MVLNISKIWLTIFILSLALIQVTSAQSSELKFNILKKDKNIGVLKIYKSESSPFTDYQVTSNVEVSIIKKFKIKASESYRYKDDLLVYSELKRSINDNIKDSKLLKLKVNKYILQNGDKSTILDEPEINNNLVRLYFTEPLKIDRVYCDNQQRMLDIKNLGENRYRIDFPNGVSNIFHYKAGKCVKVDVAGSFFQVKLLRE
ncbi:DUF6134 family protein [Christiangramia sabulilitoris]|uniref:Uncharacterized protein n=1 Tax=Christiangramia sabulilitoris TaxID=2583991 RepID=A0A550I613_9FLAO|nr:DUF6134 family protein [Christiangramia sabulilitoris]TRO66397.1 hypothetical protein FGM01_00495 [Christiangramia sabulilitoris]